MADTMKDSAFCGRFYSRRVTNREKRLAERRKAYLESKGKHVR